MKSSHGTRKKHKRNVPIGSWVDSGYPIMMHKRSMNARMLIRSTLTFFRQHALWVAPTH